MTLAAGGASSEEHGATIESGHAAYRYAIECWVARREVWSAKTPRKGAWVLSSDPTSCLAQTLVRRRAILRQCLALAGVLVGCAAWRLSPLGEPEPYTGLVLLIGSVVLVVDLWIGWVERVHATEYADELIVSGFTCGSVRTPIERAVSHRMVSVAKPRARHRLARDLRWRLRLADGTLGSSPGYVRASVLPPLVWYEREVLLAEYRRVWQMADRIDRAPAVDPRALVLLWSVVSAPPSLDRAVGREAGDELRRRLQAAAAILDSGSSDPPLRQSANVV